MKRFLTRLITVFFLVLQVTACPEEEGIHPPDDPLNKRPTASVLKINRIDMTQDEQQEIHTYDCIDTQVPCISSLTWESIEIAFSNNSKIKYKDVIITPHETANWNWKSDGTNHSGGITQNAIQRFIVLEVTDVVLTHGMEGVLNIRSDAVEALEQNGIRVHRAYTRDAVKIYNDLVKTGKKVGGLFHSTC